MQHGQTLLTFAEPGCCEAELGVCYDWVSKSILQQHKLSQTRRPFISKLSSTALEFKYSTTIKQSEKMPTDTKFNNSGKRRRLPSKSICDHFNKHKSQAFWYKKSLFMYHPSRLTEQDLEARNIHQPPLRTGKWRLLRFIIMRWTQWVQSQAAMQKCISYTTLLTTHVRTEAKIYPRTNCHHLELYHSICFRNLGYFCATFATKLHTMSSPVEVPPQTPSKQVTLHINSHYISIIMQNDYKRIISLHS